MTTVYDRWGVQVHHGAEQRLCPACHKPLVRRSDERAWDFNRRKFCNIKCLGFSQRALPEQPSTDETSEQRRKRLSREASHRARARKRGENIPHKPHPSGYQQSLEHITARVRRGPSNHAWLGDQVSTRGGRTRALRAYPTVGPCTKCGSAKSERHHIDENTANNSPENIAVLCRRCHMELDGRLDAVRRTPYKGINYA